MGGVGWAAQLEQLLSLHDSWLMRFMTNLWQLSQVMEVWNFHFLSPRFRSFISKPFSPFVEFTHLMLCVTRSVWGGNTCPVAGLSKTMLRIRTHSFAPQKQRLQHKQNMHASEEHVPKAYPNTVKRVKLLVDLPIYQDPHSYALHQSTHPSISWSIRPTHTASNQATAWSGWYTSALLLRKQNSSLAHSWDKFSETKSLQ